MTLQALGFKLAEIDVLVAAHGENDRLHTGKVQLKNFAIVSMIELECHLWKSTSLTLPRCPGSL